MRSRISESKTLKKAFQEVYLGKERDKIEDNWESLVMQRVRGRGPLRSSAVFWPAFENLVWRIAPVCFFLVFALSVLFMRMDLDPGYDYLGTVTAELERPAISELYGLDEWQ